jgi:hypothetical protein
MVLFSSLSALSEMGMGDTLGEVESGKLRQLINGEVIAIITKIDGVGSDTG